MAAIGARGETGIQLSNLVDFGAHRLVRPVAAPELMIADSLWAQNRYPFRAEYLEQVLKAFTAKVEQANFFLEADSICERINEWTSGRLTRGGAFSRLSPGDINLETQMILADAVYVQRKMAKPPFDWSGTGPGIFHLFLRRDQAAVPFMSTTHPVNYFENDEFQAVSLAYQDDFEMDVLLPRKAEGLRALEAGLTPLFWDDTLRRMKTKPTSRVMFPKISHRGHSSS